MNDFSKATVNKNFKKTILLTIILLYAYYFLEWLFFVTKPSFLTKLTSLNSFSVLFVTPLPTLLASFILVIGVHSISRIFTNDKFSQLIPTTILALIFFILIDNFTHTVFGFYVGSHAGYSQYGYFALLVLLFILAYLQVSTLLTNKVWERHTKLITLSSVSLPLISIIFILVKLPDLDFESERPALENFTKRPNIILLSTDGLIAEQMSVYGYQRETTPFIKTLVDESLFSENSFTNSAATTGSIGALISGKLPAKTGVIYPPSVFDGVHIYEHFAGLLKKNGYRNLDIGTPHFADSYDLNMRGAFDVTTMPEHKLDQNILKIPTSVHLLFSSESFFWESVRDRINSRVLHILFIKDMTDAYKMVTDIEWEGLTDQQRLTMLYKFIEEDINIPFFAHLHLMETHGPQFSLSAQYFSRNEVQNSNFMTDFYDDAILNYDNKVKELVEYLKLKNLYEDTILVLTTDHGTDRSTRRRLPLIIRFPNAKHKGRISSNTQRADIPPTIMDFLGVGAPQWMDGVSLISGEIDKKRLIFTVQSSEMRHDDLVWWQLADYSPPFYGLGALAIIQCQQWTQLDLFTKELRRLLIKNHTDPCDVHELITDEMAYEVMVNYLKKEGYDMSGFIRQ
jgi:arylsulfatase A-like enzyme